MAKGLKPVSGRAWVFGNDIDTDQIIQGQYLTLLNYAVMAKHTFEIPRPVFTSKVKKNDVVIAGRNFGGGSSREEAPKVLLQSGVGCVIAESFARIFYRNGFNVGLPLLIIPNVAKLISDGETVTVDISEGTLSVHSSGDILHGKPLPGRMIDLLKEGGAVAWYKQTVGKH
ncbi:MAG: LeuD/DmdB family oxidoreductase small subunit [Candidatus Thorarchaeota archaeon]